MRLRLALVLLAVLAQPALAGGYYERWTSDLPAQADRSAAIVLVSDRPGAVRWGLDGWQLPDPAVRPENTSVVDHGACETTFEGPCADGRYRAKLGPFSSLAKAPRELNLVVRNADGSWDSNGGKNYNVALVDPGAAPVRRRPIAIGAGAYLGKAGGQDYWEDLFDWDLEDCRGCDPADDVRPLGDGQDHARDLVAFYSRRENGKLFFRTDLLDLGMGAESSGALVIGVLVEWNASAGQKWLPNFAKATTAHPWNLALVVQGDKTFALYDAGWNVLASGANDPQGYWKGASYRSDLDAVELGISEESLRRAGWDGKAELRFQVYTQKESDGRLTDAFGERSLDDGSLDEQCSESTRGGTAKFATILHGNQAVQSLGAVRDLIRSNTTLTPNKKPTGYHRALDAHELFRAPVNFHVSATLAATIEWGAPEFNDRIRNFLRDKPWRGKGAMIGGVLSEHIMPYFESRLAGSSEGPNVLGAKLNDRFLASVYGGPRPKVFWTPERVMRGTTLEDVKAAGYSFTVLDQVTHLKEWFGAQDALSKNGRKLNRISGVSCFAINDDADQWKFANTDDGLWIWTRRTLVSQALDQDQQQLTLVFDDWEASSGRSFTSFGVGNDNPDNYDKNVRWLAAHPWIQVVTLDEVASWNWQQVERGNRPDLSVETYDWLRHAAEKSYDTWFYGSSLEEDFTAWRPQTRGSNRTPKSMGALDRPGTILHDAWADVSTLAPSALKDLAAAVYGCMVFETAWHDQSENDYLSKDQWGDYAKPDKTYQAISGWAKALQARTGDTGIVAAAARWASAPPAAGQVTVLAKDLDHDGEDESVIANDRVFCAFKKSGGRLVLVAARDPKTGDADLVAGSFLQGPGGNESREWLEESARDVKRPPCLIDGWATGGAGAYYVNAVYSITAQGSSLKLTSPDGKVSKIVSLSGTKVNVRYEKDDSVGDLYVRFALSPAPLHVFSKLGALTETRGANGALTMTQQTGSRRTQATLAVGANAWVNDGADFGFDGPRTVPFVRLAEVKGWGKSFELSLDATLTK